MEESVITLCYDIDGAYDMKKEIEVIRTYLKNPIGKQVVSYKEQWESTEYFCPNCGSHTVWRKCGEGDYYVGEDHICISCGNMFTWQNEMYMSAERMPQLIKQLS